MGQPVRYVTSCCEDRGVTHIVHVTGDIIHFTILGAHIVVLNSLDDIREMFEKRSNLYSDRPHMATIDL